MSQNEQNATLPLAGVRVIDASHVFAVPYATAMLGDLGAEVIKIQAHTRMDVMAGHGPFPENIPGERAWDRVGSLNTVNRGKLGLSLDLTKPEAIEVFRRLVKVSDVLAESFTPRVMKKLRLDYEALKQIRPDLIMLSNSGYGHSGPWHEYGSVATSLEATTGMCWLSGYEDGPPSKIGQSYTDFLACWNAVYAMLLSLYRRRRTGRGQWIDLSMYQTGASTIGPQIMDYFTNGKVATRMGNRHTAMAPHNVYRCQGEDRWIAIAIDSDAAWQSLAREMGEPPWARDARFANAPGRMTHEKFIDSQLSDWTAGEIAENLASRMQSAGIMAGVVENGRDLLHDEQLRKRNFLEPLQHAPESGIGVRRTIGRPWKLSGADLSITRPAPQLGEHNHDVLKGLLGYSDAEIDAMEQSQAIGNVMAGSPVVAPLHLEGMRRNSRIGKPDPAYRDV